MVVELIKFGTDLSTNSDNANIANLSTIVVSVMFGSCPSPTPPFPRQDSFFTQIHKLFTLHLSHGKLNTH